MKTITIVTQPVVCTFDKDLGRFPDKEVLCLLWERRKEVETRLGKYGLARTLRKDLEGIESNEKEMCSLADSVYTVWSLRPSKGNFGFEEAGHIPHNSPVSRTWRTPCLHD